jgi:8-oxo-dGTP pyrophosphatase MutT (NUDIX family)
MSEFYIEKPLDFKTELEVSTVFMECQGKLLLLHRAQCELSPETWGVPGGKVEQGETPLEGLLREIKEELNLDPNPQSLQFVRSLYVRHPKIKYQLHLFRWLLDSIPSITLDPKEHHNYLWQPIEAFADLPLLEGQLEAFHFVYN